MSFRIVLRLKSLKPHYPRKPAPDLGILPQIHTDKRLLEEMYRKAIREPMPQPDPRYPQQWFYADRIGRQTAWN